jgi:hypothetical protein
MKILSIDVGIKNLSFCLLNYENGITNIDKWDIIDISKSETFLCQAKEKNKYCEKEAKFTHSLNYFCLKHAKKQNFQLPSSELKIQSLKKQKIQTLRELAKKHKIDIPSGYKKEEIIVIIDDYYKTNFFQSIEKTNASKIDLITIGNNIKSKFNEIFNEIEFIDHVIIENQISPIANRMKTIQGMIVQYFIMSPIFVDNIEFISACNKLKECNIKTKTKYSERKKIGIQKCLEILQSNHIHSVDFFSAHKKKDDLSDCFLQGRWFIKEKIESNEKN